MEDEPARDDEVTERGGAAQALLARVTIRTRNSPGKNIPEQVCAACAELLPVTGATVSLMAHTGHRHTVAASDDTGLQMEQSQFTLGEGPSVDAFSTGNPVLVEDVAQPDQRWPVFAAEVSGWGVRAVDAYPLQQDDITIGVLVLYHDRPGAPTDVEHSEYLLVADAVRIALLTYLHGLGSMAEPTDNGDNKAVSEAIGMVMEQLGTNADTALARIRAAAFVAERPLSSIAQDITRRRLRFGDQATS